MKMDDLPKKDVITKCPRCENNLEDKPWKSQFEAGEHYKANTCDVCGKRNWVKVDFMGSGDDNWKLVEEDD